MYMNNGPSTCVLILCYLTVSHIFQLTEEKKVISSDLDSLKAEAEAVKEQLTEMKSE